MRKVFGARVERKDGSPEHNVYTEILGDGYPLDDPIGWVLNDKHSNVNTCSQPRVLWLRVSDILEVKL